MDQVDSLNEVALPNTPLTSVGVSVNNVANTSQVITVADLPSFQFFISEQAKSILALQELQNEVGALLEFRDLVVEAFPQLGQNVQNVQSSNTLSPSKWEPGVRVKRKLGQQLRADSDVSVASLLPRYRNSGQIKATRTGDTSSCATSSSAIQDSGFCTESSKDPLSGLSSRSKSRDSADELFSLLDNIHHKGTRLKLEVEYLWSRLNRRDGSCSFVISDVAVKRRCRSLDDLTVGSGGRRSQELAFEYAMKVAFLETELSALRRERDELLKKLNDIGGTRVVQQIQASRLQNEVESVSVEKRKLEERLRGAVNAESEGSRRVGYLHTNFLLRNRWRNAQTPFTKCQLLKLEQVFRETNRNANEPAKVSSTNDAKDGADGALVGEEDRSVTSVVFTPATVITSPPVHDYAKLRCDRVPPIDPVPDQELVGNATAHRAALNSSGAYNVATSNTKHICDQFNRDKSDNVVVGNGYANEQPSPFNPAAFEHCTVNRGGVTLSKERVLGILNEYDSKTLRSLLLTLSYQVEALNVHVKRISKSRKSIFRQLKRCKCENEDLKLELKRKDIELEGTKAQKRVLEQKRCGVADVKLSYSTSDLLMPSFSKPDSSADWRLGVDPMSSSYAYSVSDSALVMPGYHQSSHSRPLSSRCRGTDAVNAAGTLNAGSECPHSPNRVVNCGSTRRSCSKIPLKTFSTKLPIKVNSGGKKTFTRLKKEDSPAKLPYSSCLSSTSSSLSHK